MALSCSRVMVSSLSSSIISPPFQSCKRALMLSSRSFGDKASLMALRSLLRASWWLISGGKVRLPAIGSSKTCRALMADLASAASTGGIWFSVGVVQS
jgi:hypothetical protein